MIEIAQSNTELIESDVLAETKASLSGLKQEVLDNKTDKVDLKKKPIELGYTPTNPEKKISINLPNEYSAQGRILRCLRWKSATDAVEAKYDIPKGLLMAMMAQEGMGDPTMPNLSGDGGLGLIHIQVANAVEFGLDTTLAYTPKAMQDFEHGKLITAAKEKYGDNLTKLIKVDDRFHPIMGLDCSARFLKDKYNSTTGDKDRWLNTLRKYSARGLSDYIWPVVKYRKLISKYTGEDLPVSTFSDSTNDELTMMETAGSVVLAGKPVPLDIAKTSSEKLSISIDTKASTYEEYLTYFKGQVQNYGLDAYIAANPATSSTAIVAESANESEDEDIDGLEYIRKSTDKQWNIYKYTLASDNALSDPTEFAAISKTRKKFTGKKIQITDETGVSVTDNLYKFKKGDVIYIREKIVE